MVTAQDVRDHLSTDPGIDSAIQWCKEAGIYTIANLKNRIINHDSYKVKWIKRCEEMEKKLHKK